MNGTINLGRRARIPGRFLWLLAEFGLAALRYAQVFASSNDAIYERRRSEWLQRTCRRLLRVFNVTVTAEGAIPSAGLLVSNHLSYLDILVLGATAPAVFVSKREVSGWPIIGWFARCAGTVFVHREHRSAVHDSTSAIDQALARGNLVVLFPEGTSSGGDRVLPFKSSLLEPAIGCRHGVSACFIRYEISEGSVAEDVCYWRDMTLLPHLLNLLGKSGVQAGLSFTGVQYKPQNRKELARELHIEVLRMGGFIPATS